MAIKTFTTGEVLTASDTNTYLANSGLVYVTSATIGTGVTTATVSNCFSSTYDAYRIVITGGVATTAGNSISMTLAGLSSGYSSGIIYTTYTTAAVLVATDNNVSAWSFVGSYGTDGLVMALDLINPFLAKPTFFTSAGYANHLSGTMNGKQTSNTSASGFTISSGGTGTMTGGTITVYGYRKA